MSGKYLTKEDIRRMQEEFEATGLTEEDMYTMKNRPKEGLGSFQREPGQKIWWVDTSAWTGLFLFSFDRKKVYNMFRDYPYELTDKEKELFDRENPFWADFFKSRPRRRPEKN